MSTRAEESGSTPATPAVTVVVPVYNEERLLAGCLAALQQQDYAGPYEIVVADNGSTDRSAEIARGMGVRVVSEPHKGVVHALRTGFAAAAGEILAATDADTRVPRDWLSRLVADLTAHPGVAAAGGIYTFYDSPLWLRWASLLVNQLSRQLVGMNWATWRSAYEALGGLDPAVNLGWDAEFGRELKHVGRLLIDRKSVVETSARRYEVAGLWSSLLHYRLNDLWLIFVRQPLFYSFSDVRDPARIRHLSSLPVIVLVGVVLGWLFRSK
jgi:glycosyltransferase involved in cell wall biosynthesis